MGVSTDGILLFGVVFEDGYEFPWDADGFDGDVEDWWRDVSDYKGPPSLYDEHGDRRKGSSEKEVDDYFRHRREWLEANPLPVEVVNVCSGDYPMYALAVAGTVRRASRGYPQRVDPADLIADPAPLVAFCARHDIEIPDAPGWLLASYWG